MERLQKVIAQAGIASRRKAEEMILDGRVRINGKVVRELGTKVGPKSEIEVDGVKIEQEEHVYYVLYKPSGYVSTVDDEKGRKVITDLVPPGARVFPVGRLDYNTTGLIILTNDGEFTNMMTHPKFKIPKRYVAKVKNIPSYIAIKQLESGLELDDGYKTGSAKVRMKTVDHKKNSAILEIVISEGHNRQIRRMLEAVGSEVIKLKREQFGFLTLDGLATGDWRELSRKEVSKLRELANPTVPNEPRGKKKKK